MPERDSPLSQPAVNSPPGVPALEAGVSTLGRDTFSDGDSFLPEAPAPEAERDNEARGDLRLRLADLPPPPGDPDLVALRNLVFQRELALLDQLSSRLDDPGLHARDVSEIVAEALLLRARKDDKLARVLEPLVEKIFKHSLRKNRMEFANAFFPLMGPAIRRSIAETFRSMLESLNKSVEMSLSWKGLRWRIEGWRTGKPFSEIVLLHTLVYRVEQIFLIHGTTGLVLAHVVNDGIVSQDADMVSAMLTAIQDFVRDCFTDGRESALEQLQFEEFTILVETSPLAYLACVVRGTPPMGFRQKLRSSLELILVDSTETLADYNGDDAPFAPARRLLEDCLESRFVEERKALPLWLKALPVLFILAAVGGVGFWVHSHRLADQETLKARQAEEQRALALKQSRRAIIDRLNNEPGILVIHVVDKDQLPWEILCLRDVLARRVSVVIAEANGNPDDFKVTEVPHESFEPEIVALRVAQLHPPAGVLMDYTSDGTLTLAGTAPMQWILHAKRVALAIPGVKALKADRLSDPRLRTLLGMVHDVEASVVEFPLGKDLPVPADLPKLEKTVDTLTRLESLASEMGISVRLAVYGYADASGNDKRNFELSQARARTLASMLYARGSKLQISVYGMSTEYAQRFEENLPGDLPGRRVELRVHLAPLSPDVLEMLEE